jgi:hypothetical protein
MKLQNTKTVNAISAKKTSIFDAVDEIFRSNPSTSIIIPNTCSSDISDLSNFTRELFKNYPIVQANYEIAKKKLGFIDFIEAKTNKKTRNKIIVANIYCQENKPRPLRKIHYGLLVHGMYEIKRYIVNYKKDNTDFSIQIHSPKIGTGSAGADWSFVSELMNDIWGGQKLYVYSR